MAPCAGDSHVLEVALPHRVHGMQAALDPGGPELAAFCLQQFLGQLFSEKSGAPPPPLPKDMVAPLKQVDLRSNVDKLNFSAEGVIIPAGGDFRLPINVTAVR